MHPCRGKITYKNVSVEIGFAFSAGFGFFRCDFVVVSIIIIWNYVIRSQWNTFYSYTITCLVKYCIKIYIFLSDVYWHYSVTPNYVKEGHQPPTSVLFDARACFYQLNCPYLKLRAWWFRKTGFYSWILHFVPVTVRYFSTTKDFSFS